MNRASNAEIFHELHHGARPLLLANAWDAGTARLIASLGAPAIATTSAGMAWAHGYPDGYAIPFPVVLGTVREIVRAVDVPVTADIENGYGATLDELAANLGALLDAGVVGINIEDGLEPPDLLCARIERVRATAVAAGVRLFINARTDVYLSALAPAGERLDETLRRAGLYRSAGADGLFVPAVVEPEAIGAIAAAVPLPLNVLAYPGLPDIETLTRLGVKRLSAGSGITRMALSRTAALAQAFLSTGRMDTAQERNYTYADCNALMAISSAKT